MDFVVNASGHTQRLEELLDATFAITVFNKRFLKNLNHKISTFSVTLQHPQELGKSLCFVFVHLDVLKQRVDLF